jgi:hypothetical protein
LAETKAALTVSEAAVEIRFDIDGNVSRDIRANNLSRVRGAVPKRYESRREVVRRSEVWR